MITQLVTGFVPAIALAACTVGPNYTPPSMALTARYANGSVNPIGDVAQQQWWRGFHDSLLNSLVARGLAQNLDIRTAVEQIVQAQAAARATGLPDLVSGNVSARVSQSGGSKLKTASAREASFTPSLVIDLFGGERRAREAAAAALDAAQLDVGTARLAFLSSLVSNYIDARYYQTALAITRQTLASRQETQRLVATQQQAGIATELDAAQAKALLDETRASLPTLQAGFDSAVFAMATLLAEPAAPLMATMERGRAQPRPSGGDRIGVPADLLRNRPDVRSAERNFAQAVARVGVAEAAFYPSVSLGGTIAASNGASTWSFGPQISLPILSQPKLHAARDQAESVAKQAELNWRKTVLKAVEGVQSAQSVYLRSRQRVSATQASASSYSRVVSLSRDSYNGGAITLLDLLDAQRSEGSARLSVAQSVQAMAKSWASLQVAAGRGWEVPVIPGTEAPEIVKKETVRVAAGG